MDEPPPHLHLIRATFEWSVSQWCQEVMGESWCAGVHHLLRELGDPTLMLLAHMAQGWPVKDAGELQWEPLTVEEVCKVKELFSHGF